MAASIEKVHSVCYVVSRFPALSQTFVANEMTAVEQAGIRVELASIWSVDGGHHEGHKGHAVERPFLDRVISMNMKKPGPWLQVLKTIATKPSILLTIMTMVPEHAKSPNLIAKLVGAIPPGLWLGQHLRKNPVDHIHAHFITSPTTVALLAQGLRNSIQRNSSRIRHHIDRSPLGERQRRTQVHRGVQHRDHL